MFLDKICSIVLLTLVLIGLVVCIVNLLLKLSYKYSDSLLSQDTLESLEIISDSIYGFLVFVSIAVITYSLYRFIGFAISFLWEKLL